MSTSNQNLFAALRAAFPADLEQIAVETMSASGEPLLYSWRDLDRASARIANLLAALELPEGSRIAVQVEKSVEAMLLYLATLRAGHVFLPLNTAYQSAEIEYFVGNAEPAVVVCTPGNFGWVSKIAFTAGTQHVFTLGDDRTGSLLERAAHFGDDHVPAVKGADDLAVAQAHGRVVASVHIGELATAQVQYAVEHGDEHHLVVLGAELVVQRCDGRSGEAQEQCVALEQSARDSHEEGGRNALARDIGHDQGQVLVVDREVVIEVAPHLLGRNHCGRDVDLTQIRR